MDAKNGSVILCPEQASGGRLRLRDGMQRVGLALPEQNIIM